LVARIPQISRVIIEQGYRSALNSVGYIYLFSKTIKYNMHHWQGILVSQIIMLVNKKELDGKSLIKVENSAMAIKEKKYVLAKMHR